MAGRRSSCGLCFSRVSCACTIVTAVGGKSGAVDFCMVYCRSNLIFWCQTNAHPECSDKGIFTAPGTRLQITYPHFLAEMSGYSEGSGSHAVSYSHLPLLIALHMHCSPAMGSQNRIYASAREPRAYVYHRQQLSPCSRKRANISLVW